MLKLHGLSCHRTLKRHECLIYIKLYAMEWLPTYLNLHFWQNKKQKVSMTYCSIGDSSFI